MPSPFLDPTTFLAAPDEPVGHSSTGGDHSEASPTGGAHGTTEKDGKHDSKGHHTYGIEATGFSLLVILIVIFSLAAQAKKGLNNRYFSNWFTQRFEQLYFFIENLCVGTIGPHGRKYMPMLFTFWCVIFTGNVLSLLMPYSVTMDVSFNLGMALLAIGYVQYEGIRSNGFLGHLSHFAGPKLPLVLIPINGLIFVIEIISEVLKNITLTMRLYGNIDGGHQASDAMNLLGVKLLGQPWLNVPFGAFLMPLKLLTCVIQSLIFCLLVAIYLSMVTHHEDHGGEHGHPAPAH